MEHFKNILPIGAKAYAYDTEKPEPEIFETVVIGSFVNIETGDVYYYLPSSKQPTYAVHETEDACKESLARFKEYRAFVKEKQAEVDDLREKLGQVNAKKALAGLLYPAEEGAE